MMKLVLIAALLAPCTAAASGVTFAVENFQRTETGAPEIVIKFNNGTAGRIDYAAASCGLLDERGRALTTIDVIAQNIAPGGYAFAKSYGPQDERIAKLDCRLRDIDATN